MPGSTGVQVNFQGSLPMYQTPGTPGIFHWVYRNCGKKVSLAGGGIGSFLPDQKGDGRRCGFRRNHSPRGIARTGQSISPRRNTVFQGLLPVTDSLFSLLRCTVCAYKMNC